MKLSQYGYDFAPEMLAKHPTENRDDSRLMVIDRAKGTIEHRIFKDIIEYFDEKDLFVFNDTKVFPARLYGNKEKTGAEIEIFLLRELNRELRLWDVLVDPARKIRIGNKLYFGDDDLMVAEVIDNTTSRGRTLRFLFCTIAERELPERAIGAWRSLLPSFESAALDANPAPALVLADGRTVARERLQGDIHGLGHGAWLPGSAGPALGPAAPGIDLGRQGSGQGQQFMGADYRGALHSGSKVHGGAPRRPLQLNRPAGTAVAQRGRSG